MYINCYIFKYLTMKEKDNGITILAKENCDNRISPKETDDRSDISDKNSLKNEEISCTKNEDKNNKIEEQNDNRLKINEIENNKNEVKLKNCVDKIDLDKNLIVLNKKNLKEMNTINKEINKKNQLIHKKGEIINIYGNNKFYYTNQDITNTINKSYGFFSKNLESQDDNFGKIKYNIKFPNDVIEKFFERKKIKKKENKDNNNYYINSFGNNPLERLKEIQEKLNDPAPTTKNTKITLKQFKTNQKKLKEEDYKIQNYIKFFPVFNCPEHKIFKLNEFFYYNRIYDDKNNYYNKKPKNNNSKNKIKEEVEKEKDESEEDTIDRHIKKKFINKKRNKSKNKENKNYCEV